MTGLEAATSGVEMTVPTLLGLNKSLFMVKTSKLGWFSTLKNSPPNWNCVEQTQRDVNGSFLLGGVAVKRGGETDVADGNV